MNVFRPVFRPKIGTRLSSYKVMAIEAASLFQGSAILLFCQAIFQNVWRVLKLCEVATGLPYLNIWSMHETSLHGNSNFFLRWKPSRLSQKNRKVPSAVATCCWHDASILSTSPKTRNMMKTPQLSNFSQRFHLAGTAAHSGPKDYLSKTSKPAEQPASDYFCGTVQFSAFGAPRRLLCFAYNYWHSIQCIYVYILYI